MLGMEGDEDNSGAFEETGNSSGAASNSDGVELFAAQWLHHTLKFIKIESRMSQKVAEEVGFEPTRSLHP
jgi:hypothetical protein